MSRTYTRLLTVSRADLAVHIGVLEGLNEAKSLVNIAANRQVVNGDLAEDSGGRDEEEAAEWEARDETESSDERASPATLTLTDKTSMTSRPIS